MNTSQLTDDEIKEAIHKVISQILPDAELRKYWQGLHGYSHHYYSYLNENIRVDVNNEKHEYTKYLPTILVRIEIEGDKIITRVHHKKENTQLGLKIAQSLETSFNENTATVWRAKGKKSSLVFTGAGIGMWLFHSR